jgi:hypothetical protein
MKKYLFIIGFILFGSNLFAESRVIRSTGSVLPGPAGFRSEAVYYASFTCVASNLDTVILSTRPAFGYNIKISSPGAGNPFVEVFDARKSTDALSARRVDWINSMTQGNNLYNIGFSSGLAVSNQGQTPACICVIYSEY